jgi:GT2 family glycosyltransferase
MSEKVNILILNWRCPFLVKQCIERIVTSQDENYRVIIINNFSTLSDYNDIFNLYEYFKISIEIYFVSNESNLGYAGGNNAGFSYLEQNNLEGNVMILNPDVEISINTIGEMMNSLTSNVGIVSPRTLSSNGEVLYDAIKLRGFRQSHIITSKHIVSTDFSQGSCMLIDREVLRSIGLFDERFFLYWEEVDLSLRVKDFGKDLIAITTTSVVRKNNTTDNNVTAFYYWVRNASLLRTKHKRRFSFFSYFLFVFLVFTIIFKKSKNVDIFRKLMRNYFLALRDTVFKSYYSKRTRG